MSKPSGPEEGSTASEGGKPGDGLVRFRADRIIFGSDERHNRWSFPDVTADSRQEAAWKARYQMAKLTQTDCFHLAEAVEVLGYLVFDCPTTAIAVEKLRAVRRELNKRAIYGGSHDHEDA